MTIRPQHSAGSRARAPDSSQVVPQPEDSGRRRSWWPILAIFALAIATRVPLASEVLYHWDSVNIALGMHDFDVARQQPQPPGYILYIALARGVDAIFGDPQTTLVAVSIVFSGLAAAAMFALARAMLPRHGDLAGWIAALLLISSPLVWFYGEIALPHAVDLFFVTSLALVAWQVRRGEHGLLLPLAVLLGVAGGIRQQTLTFLLPLVVWCAWRLPLRKLLVPGLIFAGLTLIWMVPLLLSAGGPGAYLALTGHYSETFFDPTSLFGRGGLAGLWRNSSKLALYTLYGTGVAALPLLTWIIWRAIGSPGAQRPLAANRPVPLAHGGISAPGGDVNVLSQAAGADVALRPATLLSSMIERLRSNPGADAEAPGAGYSAVAASHRRWGGLTSERVVFLGLWILPAAAFYSLIHMGQPGLVLTYLPALLVAATAALLLLGRTLLQLDRRSILLAGAGLALLNASVFLFAPEYPLGPGYSRVLSRSTIENHDRWFQERIAAIQSGFTPADSLVLARDTRVLGYYLPGYSIVRAPAPPQGTDPLLEPADFSLHALDRAGAGLAAGGDWWVLLPDDHWHEVEPSSAAETTVFEDGRLTALKVPAGGKIEFNGVRIRVLPR